MASVLSAEIENLKKSLVDMAAQVETMLSSSIRLITERENIREHVDEIKSRDDKVDRMEVDIDRQCVRLLSLYAPEAAMLRTIITVMRINNDMERIADHAVNVARLATKISAHPPMELLKRASEMGDSSLEMFRKSMDAFINGKIDLAFWVSERDKDIDDMEKEIIKELMGHLTYFPESLEAVTCLIVLLRNLERAADLATNISEDTHYAITGEVIKHRANPSGQEI